MKPKIAMTSNAERFLNALTALENRAAREASWLLVTGRPGTGKSELVQWWALQQGAVYKRALTGWTVHWMLSDLLHEMGHAPGRTTEESFGQLIGILARDPRPIVIDEVEHCFHDGKVIEKLRDISDLTEVPIIIVGMEDVRAKFLRREQISSRICQAVEFTAATKEDVRRLATTLCEVGIQDDLIGEIHSASGGVVRVILDCLAEAERQGRRSKLNSVGLADMAGQKLTHDWRTRKTITARKPQPVLEVIHGASS